jgi:ADP-glucose pyrophosphorylase
MDAVEVGRHAQIQNCIIDKFSEILPGVRIGFDLERDRSRFHMTSGGIVVVPKGSIVDQDDVRSRWIPTVSSNPD